MTFNPGDVVTVDFPGVTGVKRRPAVILSSATYHANRPDVIVGLITSSFNCFRRNRLRASGLASSWFTGCVCFSEFHCNVASFCQLGLYWAVIRA